LSVFNDILASASLQFTTQTGITDFIQVADLVASVATEQFYRGLQSIPTSDTAINLGSLGAINFFMAVNRDPTNYLDIKTAVAGKIVAHLLPGYFCVIPLGSDMQAPSAIAHTGACVLDYLVGAL
jgi:hypothetical protein